MAAVMTGITLMSLYVFWVPCYKALFTLVKLKREGTSCVHVSVMCLIDDWEWRETTQNINWEIPQKDFSPSKLCVIVLRMMGKNNKFCFGLEITLTVQSFKWSFVTQKHRVGMVEGHVVMSHTRESFCSLSLLNAETYSCDKSLVLLLPMETVSETCSGGALLWWWGLKPGHPWYKSVFDVHPCLRMSGVDMENGH